MSGDEQLIGAYNAGRDLYATMAATIHHNDYWDNMEHYEDGTPNPEGKKRRSAVKKLTLAILYGMGADSLGADLNIPREDAQKLIDDFYRGYPVVKKFIDGNIDTVHKIGYVEDVMGRRRRLPDAQLPKYTIKYKDGRNTTFNPILGTDTISSKREDSTIKAYSEKLKSARGWREAKSISDEALKEGIVITNNSGFISRAERQSTNCVDEDTEILTKCGWKRWNEIKVGDEIYSLDMSTGKIVDDMINDIFTYNGEYDCIEIKHSGFESVSTPNHRFPTYSKNSPKITFCTTEELSKHISYGCRKIIKSADNDFVGNIDWSQDMLYLLGIWLTDGSCYHIRNKLTYSNRYACALHQSKNDIKKKIVDALNSSGIKYTERNRNGYSTFYILQPYSNNIGRMFPNRKLTYDFINTLSQSQARCVLNGMFDGDGWGDHITVPTKEEVDILQYLIVRAGMSSSYKVVDAIGRRAFSKKINNKGGYVETKSIYYIVSLYKRRHADVIKSNCSHVRRNFVWCVSTNNHTWIARGKNGHTYITGNSRIQGCLTYDTKIITKDGVKSIGDAVGDSVVVWDGEQWTHSKVVYSGKKRLCVLTTVDGEKILCSPDHRFLVTNTKGKTTFKKLSEIKPSYHWLNVASGAFSTGSSAESIKNLVPHVGKHANNRHDYSFDDIQGDFDRGVVLGRISSDGSYIMRGNGHGVVYLCVAEHEYDVLEYLKSVLPYKYTVYTTQKKNQKLYRVAIYSTSLCEECIALDLKHQIHKIFYSNSEMLRGFLCGIFDGDGGVNTHGGVFLTFGTQCDFTSFTEEIREALYLFGIRSVTYKFNSCYRVSVRKSNCKRFASVIGFINKHKQELAESISTVRDGHTFDFRNVVKIKSIEVTDEFVDMYDVCDTERGYFVANGLVVHNSASTVTKLAMINVSKDKELNELGFRLLICVHDELLGECPKENSERVAKRLAEIMIESAKPVCSVKMSVDTYRLFRWYADDFSDYAYKQYQNLIKDGNTKEQAETEILNKYDMVNTSVMKSIFNETFDVTSEII